MTELSTYLQNEYGLAKFDFLINNAGTGGHTAFVDATEDEFDTLVNIHFKGVYFLTQKLLPYLKQMEVVLSISHQDLRFSHPNTSMYASVKGAMEVVTRILALELGKRQIRVNIVVPVLWEQILMAELFVIMRKLMRSLPDLQLLEEPEFRMILAVL